MSAEPVVPAEQLPGVGKIHAAIAAIMAEVGGVRKGRKNVQQGYEFRGIADITLACQPVMAKHGVHIVAHAVLHEDVHERETAAKKLMLHIRQRIQFRFYHADGSYVACVATGEAMDTGDKTSNKVMSAALKYALTQTFCIPEDDPEQDTEHASPEVAAKEKPKPTAAPPTPAPNGNGSKPKPEIRYLSEDEKNLVRGAARAVGIRTGSAWAEWLLVHSEARPGLKGVTTTDEIPHGELGFIVGQLQAQAEHLKPKEKTEEEKRAEIEAGVDEAFGVTA